MDESMYLQYRYLPVPRYSTGAKTSKEWNAGDGEDEERKKKSQQQDRN